MNETVLVRTIAYAMVGVALLNLALVGITGQGPAGAAIGLGLTAVFAWFMMRGHNWARWLFVVRCLFTALAGAISFIYLDKQDIPRLSLPGLLILGLTLLHGVVGAFLVFSSRVNRYFDT